MLTLTSSCVLLLLFRLYCLRVETLRTGTVAQWVSAPVAEPESLNLIPEIYMLEEENSLPKNCPLTSMHIPWSLHMPAHINNNKLISL